MKIDLHCHSLHSKRPTLWVMQKLGCPESFSEPAMIYARAREKGMDAVTITDHNVIDGALEIAHLPGAFMGCEYTTYFPDDRCKVHVLVYGMTEAQHGDLSLARENIHDFVQFVNEAGLRHTCAHPLFWVNDRLTLEHIEQLALLFKNWELNGEQDSRMNDAILTMVQHFTESDISRLAEKHGIDPVGHEPWRKNLTGGSDDHSSMNLARTFTEVPGAQTLNEFWQGVGEGAARVRCNPVSPKAFARSVYGIAYQFYKNRFALGRHVNRDIFLRFVDRSLTSQAADATDSFFARVQLKLAEQRWSKLPRQGEHSFLELLRREAERKIRKDPQLMAVMRDGFSEGSDPDQKWFEFLTEVSDRLLAHCGRRFLDRLVGARFVDLFQSAGSAGTLYFLLAPYFMGFSLHAQERRWARSVLAHFGAHWNLDSLPKGSEKLAHFTDTLHDVNGVARTLRRQLRTARGLGKDYSLVTCFGEEQKFERGVCQFRAVDTYALPEYPELRLRIPPFLQMLSHCHEEGYTHLHVSTPGPVGLTALAIARILQIPISGTYHTAFPQYAKALTDDSYVEDMTWRFMLWFYEQLDAVYVPSQATGRELAGRGLDPGKIRVYPRGVDTDLFHPRKRADVFQTQYGLEHGALVLLYAGRVSREKNLHVLSQAYRAYVEEGGDAHLVVAGDGPFLDAMKKELEGTPAVFAGCVGPDALAVLYASSDVFVFPSATDTFGNVVLEAQASGTPVIVSDQGGPRENVIPDKTGIVVDTSRPEALLRSITSLLSNEDRRLAMGAAAREYMEGRGFDQAFEQLWAMYTSETQAKGDWTDLMGFGQVPPPVAAIAS